MRGDDLAQRIATRQALADRSFGVQRQQLFALGMCQEHLRGLVEIGLKTQNILFEDAEGVEGSVVSNATGSGTRQTHA